jgi:hypothetical protein
MTVLTCGEVTGLCYPLKPPAELEQQWQAEQDAAADPPPVDAPLKALHDPALHTAGGVL